MKESVYSDVEIEAHKSSGDRTRLVFYGFLVFLGGMFVLGGIILSFLTATERNGPPLIIFIVEIIIGIAMIVFGIYKRRIIKGVITYRMEKKKPEYDKGEWVASKKKERKDIHIDNCVN